MFTHRWGMAVAFKKPVSDYMTHSPVFVTLDDRYETVKKLMRERQINHVPVVDCDAILGIISHKDILRFAYSEELQVDEAIENADLNQRVSIRRLMSSPVITIDAHSPIQLATELMLKHRISCLPVIYEKTQLVGIITTSDILKLVLDNI